MRIRIVVQIPTLPEGKRRIKNVEKPVKITGFFDKNNIYKT